MRTIKLVMAIVGSFASLVAVTAAENTEQRAAELPLWDLAKDKVPEELRHGGTYHDNGTVSLQADEWFGVPATAFPDQKNFTVQVSVSFPELRDDTHLNLLLKQARDGEDTGFGLSCINSKNWKVHRPVVNGMHIGGTRLAFQPNTAYTFTVTARNGMLAYYLNDQLGSRHFTLLLPNDEPLWVGKKLLPREQPFPAAAISALKVYGADFKYVSPKEKPTAEPRGAIAGKNWAIDAPTVVDPKRPKILFYGDSISGGYRQYLLPALEGKVYAYHWTHFVGGLGNWALPLIQEGAAAADFQIIFFNNGLHSLAWTPEKATDQQIADTTRSLVRGFKTGAPQAKLYWIATTPHTARRPAPDKPVDMLGDKNAVVLRINRIAAQVMQEEGVEIIDMYTPLAARLDLAAGDEYHWSGPAYKLIADAVAAKTCEVLRLKDER
jgi:lysophospholipase L1-like esterase